MTIQLLALASLVFTPQSQPGSQPALTRLEREGLIHMREEEKMARDVYSVFADKFGQRPFGNIVRSEQNHFDAVKTLLDRYSVADPSKGREPGDYLNKDLAKMHRELLKSGSESRVEALMAGATVEELDLVDLEKYTALVRQSDIKAVYANLAKGSRNHLRAFVSGLKASGIEYAPQYLGGKRFKEIVESPMERGRGG